MVGDEQLEQFALATGDRNPIHFDDAYAAETRLAGGSHTACWSAG